MKRWLGILMAFAVLAGWLWIARRQPEPKPAATSVTREPSEDVNRCKECHSSHADDFLKTGHALALRPGNDPEATSRFAGQTIDIGQPAVRFRFWDSHGKLWFANDMSGLRTPVSWIFGSGNHGMTPVALAKNPHGEEEGPDLHVSWYHSHGLALTMGHESVLSENLGSLGSFNDASNTQRCFHCHTTELTKKGRGIVSAQLLPGVLCSKCHTEAKMHAERMNGGQSTADFDTWKSLSPEQSVARCGECHRSPVELEPENIQPEFRQLARFASVGLPQSRCFQFQANRTRDDNSARRLDCLTCHDPHRPMPTDVQHYNNRCRDCHTRPDSTDSDCPKRPITSDCVGCHMPKVRMNAPVAFTDHWIRVRTSSDPESPDSSPSK